jgi:uncharacterized protein (DUF433 family)
MPATPAYQPKPLPPDLTRGDLVAVDDPRHGIIWIDPERMSGVPCFYGTRVPIQTMFDYLEAGQSLNAFLDGFPPITRAHALAVLELAKRDLLRTGRAA